MSYTELQVTTNFSFLRGGSHPGELVEQAAKYGQAKIAITDRNSVAGVVRAHMAAKEEGIQIMPACRLDLMDGPSLLAYPTDQDAWARLCALLTTGNLRAEKGDCHLCRQDVFDHAKGIKFMVVPPAALNKQFDFDEVFKADLAAYREVIGNDLYLAASRSYSGDDAKRLYRLSRLGVPMVATNDVHYHEPARRELQDILTCVREKSTIQNAGFLLHPNAERHLKPTDEMQRLFRQYPDAIRLTQEIADACVFSLDTLKYIEPEEISPDGLTPQERLTKFTWEGARKRFGDDVPKKIGEQIEFELAFIERKNLASY
ncbi:MAG: error-prone polymerase, partial [Mucilaginibacter sp.]|nr:error-prone polymerase [Mucilaginibacter sp.]